MSCSHASVETTMSPILISARSEPATPVLITASTANKSARICTQMPALTLPIPHWTMTTSFPFSTPSWNFIPALSTTFFSVIFDFNSATSSSIAPIIPILFILNFPPNFMLYFQTILPAYSPCILCQRKRLHYFVPQSR